MQANQKVLPGVRLISDEPSQAERRAAIDLADGLGLTGEQVLMLRAELLKAAPCVNESVMLLTPFVERFESEVVTISQENGGMTIENRDGQVYVYGNLTVDQSKEGLADIELLKAVVDQLYFSLKSHPCLPDKLALPSDGVVTKMGSPFK